MEMAAAKLPRIAPNTVTTPNPGRPKAQLRDPFGGCQTHPNRPVCDCLGVDLISGGLVRNHLAGCGCGDLGGCYDRPGGDRSGLQRTGRHFAIHRPRPHAARALAWSVRQRWGWTLVRAPESCAPYSTDAVQTRAGADNSWTVTDGGSLRYVFASQEDAQSAQILVSRHTEQCFISLASDGPNAGRYLTQYWR